MKTINLSILSISAALLMSGCYYDNFKELRPAGALPSSTSGCDTTGVIGYASQIAPIISANCIGCHTAGGSAHPLNTYAEVSVDAVGALYGSISQDGSAQNMPQGGTKLSDCDIAKIKKWIDTGLQP